MKPLYRNDKTTQIDSLAASALGIDSFELMQKAGEAIYQHVKQHQSILVITGPGNNGGDGFVVAELARQNHQQVKVWALKKTADLTGDARKAADLYQGESFVGNAEDISNESFDCVVDSIFGTGLNQPVTGHYAAAIDWINQQPSYVVAVDVPSGLNGSTGKIEACAVRASKTISILVANTGLFTLDGKDCCGEVVTECLGLDLSVFETIKHDAILLNKQILNEIPNSRIDNSHKGRFGHVLTAGGQAGMMGAVLLAGKAVLKSGAGLTTVVTDRVHAELIPLQSPELMTLGFDGLNQQLLNHSLQDRQADVILLGMGLGHSQWSKGLYKSCLQAAIPTVMDADALTLLAQAVVVPDQLKVITPHPKEAASLLSVSIEAVQQDRWLAVKKLAIKYRCVTVLKGSGTLISDGNETWCCSYGNANLATAGSGDVLAGMVAGLMAQGFDPVKASILAVVWHALAGETSPYGLTMTASDLLNTLHHSVN